MDRRVNVIMWHDEMAGATEHGVESSQHEESRRAMKWTDSGASIVMMKSGFVRGVQMSDDKSVLIRVCHSVFLPFWATAIISQ